MCIKIQDLFKSYQVIYQKNLIENEQMIREVCLLLKANQFNAPKDQ